MEYSIGDHTNLPYRAVLGLGAAGPQVGFLGHKGGYGDWVDGAPTASSVPRWCCRNNILKEISRRYGLKRLVWKEFHEDIRAAIQRESNIKHWPRAWKIRLIHTENREWRDLFEELN